MANCKRGLVQAAWGQEAYDERNSQKILFHLKALLKYLGTQIRGSICQYSASFNQIKSEDKRKFCGCSIPFSSQVHATIMLYNFARERYTLPFPPILVIKSNTHDALDSGHGTTTVFFCMTTPWHLTLAELLVTKHVHCSGTAQVRCRSGAEECSR